MEQLNEFEQLLTELKLGKHDESVAHESIVQREVLIAELEQNSKAYQGLGIKILAILGGVLASFFFFGFTYMMFGKSSYATLIFGIVILVAAIFVEKAIKNTVLDSICVCSLIVGCALISTSVERLTHSQNITTLVVLLVAIITIATTSAKIFNLLATLAVNGCLYALIESNKLEPLYHVFATFLTVGFVSLNLAEAKFLTSYPSVSRRYEPLRTGFMISLVAMLFHYLGGWRTEPPFNWVSGGIFNIASLFVVHQLIIKLKIVQQQWLVYTISILVLSSCIFEPTISGSILLILVSFYVSYHLGTATGIIALIYFVGQFYYDLSFTLLEKSLMMMATGTLFLIAWFIFKKQLKYEEQH